MSPTQSRFYSSIYVTVNEREAPSSEILSIRAQV